MSKSEPLTVKVIIHDKELSAIVDTGAAISVMSEALVKKLDLKTNDDTVSIQLLDGTNSKPGGVVPNVPVRIGGKLRTEHFAIQKGRKDELLILGMTWLKNYGIIPDPESGTVTVPYGRRVDYKGAVVREAGQVVLTTQRGTDDVVEGQRDRWVSRPVYTLNLAEGAHSAPEPMAVSNCYDGESSLSGSEDEGENWEICDMTGTPKELVSNTISA
ncbi:hypothetical protein G6F16_013646 [Rhizopus arrhizus]|nr:hypothetical protein G6F18_013674 [Rhizopus arrhizus]KAG0855462.1 hypothetical protein G6F16_013646 [Rhizopus arrhizus]KAG0861787.1 hypothetical protein G6F15_013695 [Rhizopus arrhizus]